MSVDRCVHCGEIVPEDRMACWSCEQRAIKLGSILQANQATVVEVEDAYEWLYKGETNGKE